MLLFFRKVLGDIASMKSKKPFIIFILCWSAYALAYFGRVNISVALPSIQESFGWSKTTLGLIGTSFFAFYALGQLFNGLMGDKLNPRWFVFTGLAVSGILNFSFGFSSSLFMMMVIWAFNGYFQSMLWGPIVRTLSKWIHSGKNNLLAVGMQSSMTIGYLLAWGLSGKIVASAGWKWAFWLPGITLFIFSFVWLISLGNLNRDRGNFSSVQEKEKVDKVPFWKMATSTGLWFVFITCIAQGIVKEGINLWGPLLLKETQNLDLKSTVSYIIFIPIVSFFGSILASWLNKLFKYREKIVIFILMTSSIFTIIMFFTFGKLSPISGAIFLALTSGLITGTNSMLLTIIPLSFTKKGRVSSVAGFLDFSSYIGAGLSGVLTGLVSDLWSWNGVIIVWIGAIIIGTVSILIANTYDRKIRKVMK